MTRPSAEYMNESQPATSEQSARHNLNMDEQQQNTRPLKCEYKLARNLTASLQTHSPTLIPAPV